jgi:uncharacterized protein involved in exopolysaccharide biosynthesis
MSREEAPRELRRRPVAEPVPDAEEEIDLGRYATAIAARWWLPLLGLVAGVLVGYLLSVGGSEVYRAQALVYLGDPIAPGGARVETFSSNLSSLRELVRAETSVRRAAAESGMTPAEVRSGTTVQQVSGGTARTGQPSLVNIGVRGDGPRKTAVAAQTLARIAVADISPYANAKIASLEGQIAAANEELESLERRISASLTAAQDPGLSDTDKLVALTNAGVLEQRRSTVLQTRSDRQQQLALAETVEKPQVLKRATARKVTAQSRRNSLVAAGALGLLLGLFAALAWDRVAPRFARA